MPFYPRRRGARYELELARLLWRAGWAVVRAGASGGGRRRWPAPDLLAVRDGTILVIEVKSASHEFHVYVERHKLNALIDLAKRAGGIPVVAVRRPRGRWQFYLAHDVCPHGKCRVDRFMEELDVCMFIEQLCPPK